MIITEIKKGRRGNYLLFSDSGYFMSLKAEILIKKGIKTGYNINENEIEEIKKENNLYKAKEKAFHLLSYRSRSQKELKDRIKKEAGENCAETVVKKMETLGLINDKVFARQYCGELFLNKKMAIAGVRYKLREKGIDDEIVEEVLKEFDINEEKQILSLLNGKFLKKMKNENTKGENIENEKGKNRVINSLSRLGYSWSTIKRALALFEEGIKEDDLI